MKRAAFLLNAVFLLHCNGCRSLGILQHQLGPEEAHSLIEVIAPAKSLRDLERGHRELGVSVTLVEVHAIDGIPLPFEPGENQSFRLKPGKHEVRYKMTSVGYFPIENPVSKIVSGGFFALGGFGIPDEVYGHNQKYVSKPLNTVAGKHYRLSGFKVDVSEIKETKSGSSD